MKIDIPAVGKNYFDHLNMPVAVNLDAPVSVTLNKLQTFATLADYFVFGTGINFFLSTSLYIRLINIASLYSRE